MRRRAAAEHGSALVTALVLTMIMLTVGLAGLAQVDVQQEQSGVERIRETSFNLGEGLLNAQIFALSQNWPGPGAGAGTVAAAPFVFADCTQASSSSNCPDPAMIRRLFASPDTGASTTWLTEVRDNATTLPCATSTPSAFYSDASTADQPAFDCNGDGKLWVRAQATVRGRTRAVVALVQAERETFQLPRSALLAGRLEIGNSGNKVLIDAKADTALTTAIRLRCDPATKAQCVDDSQTTLIGIDDLWTTDRKLSTQLGGTKPKVGYSEAPALSPGDLERLRRTAITNGTYFDTCPTDPNQLAGAVVYVKTCNQAYNSNVTINTAESPGALIIENGSIDFQGNTTFHGLIYHANLAGSTEELVKLTGNNGVKGAVFVEKQGGFRINGSAYLTVNGKAFEALRTYSSAGIIQNTWREIASGP